MPQVQGKPGPMDWSSFVARRRLDVAAWCLHNRFKTYADVKKWCAANSVEAPDKHVVTPHLLKKQKTVQTKTSSQDAAPKSTKKRTTKKSPDSIVG